MKIAAALCLLCPSMAAAFSSPPPAATRKACLVGGAGSASSSLLRAEPAEGSSAAAVVANDVVADVNDSLEIPLSYNEMILQASQCMSDAYDRGIARQIVRVLLPRDGNADRLGVQFEADARTDGSDRSLSNRGETKLVPSDESWQGGIMQLYRAASPTAKDVLRRLSPTTATTGVPPRIVEDRSVDESGVDGVGLLYTRPGGRRDEVVGETNEGGFGGLFGEATTLPALSEDDRCIFVQPTQETADMIDDLTTATSAGTTSAPLVALLNPQWRDVDDALDSASKSDGLFGAVASFLGGKGSVLRRLDELGYRPTYALEGYVCKGGNVRLLKRFDSDWTVFAESDSGDSYVRLGSTRERPSYQDVDKMLDDKGVGFKYARDLGMAPKL